MTVKQAIEFMRIVPDSTSISKEKVLSLLESIEHTEQYVKEPDVEPTTEDTKEVNIDAFTDELQECIMQRVEFWNYVDADSAEFSMDGNMINLESVELDEEGLTNEIIRVLLYHLDDNNLTIKSNA